MPDPAADLVLGPCSPYVTDEDVTEDIVCRAGSGDDGDGATDEQIDELRAVATDVTWILLGRPNLGVCEVTIYPCQQVHRWRWWGQRDQSPLGVSGPCVGCGDDQAIRLDTPVRDVAEVVVNNEALSTDDYYLLDGVWLVRCNHAWPAGADCDYQGFSITYSFGEEPSYIVKAATLEVLRDLWDSRPAHGSDLPGATSVNRQGIGWSAENEAERASHMGLALPSLAKAVQIYNPSGQPFQPMAYSPDEPYRNRTIRTF